MRLTRDHTLGPPGAPKVPIGPMLDVNTTARDLKHILTNTLGMSGPVGPSIDLERLQLDDGDRVLVCSNGVTDYVSEDEIGRVLASGDSPDDQSRTLADRAVDSGGEDDATAVVGWYSIPK
jgi:PPM family protein phosphatase